MSTQYITSIGLNYNVWDFTWRVSDCEELVGGSHRRWWVYSVKVTALRLFDVPEVLLSQEIPSDEVRMLPL